MFIVASVSKGLQTPRPDWLRLGADLAHVLVNGVMNWMCVEMIAMTMNMSG